MTKKVRLFLTMLFLTLLGGVNAAWADEVDITPQQALDGGVSPITVTCAKGDGTTNPAISSGQLRLYQAASGKTTGNTITFSSEYAITSIEFTFANGMTADNGVFSEGSYDSSNYTWTGSTNSLTLTCTGTRSGERIYITAMTVTYEGSSGPVDPTVQLLQERVNVGGTMQISYPDDLDVTFSSVPLSVATVDNSGLVTGVSAGTATISAVWGESDKYNSGRKDFVITVVEAGTSDSEVIDFENIAAYYTNWIFTNIVSKEMNSNVPAHGGSYFGNTNGKASGSIQTKEKIATPNSLTCYLSKQSTNTTPSSWKIQVSSDGETWTDVAETSAVDMTRGEWKEFSADLSAYTDVYVRVYYDGTTAVRDIDDLTLVTTAPAVAKPTFDPADGEYTEAQSVTITCTTEGATIYYTTDGTEPTNQSTEYTDAITVDETTTIKAIAYVGTDASSVATATYTIVEPLSLITIAEARAQQTGEVLTAGIVTSVNGRTAYIQDNTAAIVVYGSSNLSVTIGDAITVQGTLTTYNWLLEITSPEITVTSQGNTVEPVVTAIADISNDNQAKLIKIENATVTAIDGKNVTIAQGEDEITVYFNNTNDITFAVNEVISLTGNIGCYNNPQIANPRDIDVQGAKYYVIGYHNNWDNGSAVSENLELKRTSDGTLKVSVDLGGEGQNGDFKIIKVENGATTAWYGAEADGSFWVTADNYTDIPLVDYDGAPNLHLNTYGTYDFTLNISGNQPTLTVDGDWPRKNYYVIGQGVGSLEEMLEMTYNEDKGVYECEITFRDTDAPGYWFAISDIASASSWDDLNANHRYSVQSGDYTLTKDNSSNVQLIKTNGTMMVYNAGTYKLTLTEDLKLTVTGWPIILDGNAFVKVTSTDDLTDGYYLIVYEGDKSHKSVAFDGSLETLDAAFNTIDVTIAEKLIVANSTTNAAVFTIEGGTLKSASEKYIGRTSNSNGMNESVSTEYENTFSIDEDGNAVITSSAGPTLRFNYGSNDLRFRYYKTSQQPIALYKLTTVDEIPVTIGSTGYGTLYYSDLALAIPEGVTATYVSSVENGKIEFTNVAERVSTNVIPAGTPVVLKATQGEYKFLVVDESETESPDNNMLCGTDVATTTTAPANAANYDCKFYMLSKKKGGDDSTVGFYYGTGCPNGEAFTNGAHKAYLVVPQMDGSTGAKSFYLFSDAVTDGIGAVENSIFNLDDAKIYNLNGQRVSTPQRGIYIINGKKVLVK